MGVRRTRVQFSLFAFQDIITGLCGILILIVLTMTLDFANTREEPAAPPEPLVSEHADIEKLELEIAALQKELAAAREAAKRMIVSIKGAAAPEVAQKLAAELSETERERLALFSQVEALRQRVAAARKADARNRQKVREMEETRRMLEKRLTTLTGRNGITLIPERGLHKIPVYLVCGRGGVEVLRPLEKSAERRWIPLARLYADVENELLQLDHTTHTVILLVRPSGVEMMDKLASRVKDLGFSCGRDPLEENVDVTVGSGGGGR